MGGASIFYQSKGGGLDGSATSVLKIFTPTRQVEGEIIEGETVEEKVGRLIDKMREAQVL